MGTSWNSRNVITSYSIHYTKLYEEQKNQGNQTALAEKDDYQTFDVRVGNIPPQSEVRVRLVYYQALDIDLNVGRYLYLV